MWYPPEIREISSHADFDNSSGGILPGVTVKSEFLPGSNSVKRMEAQEGHILWGGTVMHSGVAVYGQ